MRPDTKPGRAMCRSCECVWNPHQVFTDTLQARLKPREPNNQNLACLDCGNEMVELQVEKLDAFLWSCPACKKYLLRPRERKILEKRQSQLAVGEHFSSLSDKGKRSFFRQLNDTHEAETWASKELRPYRGAVSYADPDDFPNILRFMPAVRAEQMRYRHFLAPLLTTLSLLTMLFFGQGAPAPDVLQNAGVLSLATLQAFLLHTGFGSLVTTHILLGGIEDRMPRWLLLIILCTLFSAFGLGVEFIDEQTILLGGQIMAFYSALSALLVFPKGQIYFPYSDSKWSLPSWLLALTLIGAQVSHLNDQNLSYQFWTVGISVLLAVVTLGFIHGLGFNLQAIPKNLQGR